MTEKEEGGGHGELHIVRIIHNDRVVAEAPLYVYDYEATLEAIAGVLTACNRTLPDDRREGLKALLPFLIDTKAAHSKASARGRSWLDVIWKAKQ